MTTPGSEAPTATALTADARMSAYCAEGTDAGSAEESQLAVTARVNRRNSWKK